MVCLNMNHFVKHGTCSQGSWDVLETPGPVYGACEVHTAQTLLTRRVSMFTRLTGFGLIEYPTASFADLPLDARRIFNWWF